MEITPEKFNVRVYGLWIAEQRLLCCRENYKKDEFVKFPGGGLDFGEGITDCLIREFKEETGTAPESFSLFYVNEFYQQSAFNPKDQLISLYYLVQGSQPPVAGEVCEMRHNEPWVIQTFWKDLRDVQTADFTFPVDRIALEKLKANF